jgi:GntR family transcriptional regulator of abcA and norABC
MDEKKTSKKKKPLYKQIAEEMEHRISVGEFPPGSLLPSERSLAKEWNVNRSTIVAAYEELRVAGIVERKQGSGTVVSRDIWGLARNRVPDWRRLIETGSFQPNLPLIRSIRKEIQENDLIDLASGELSADLFPAESIQQMMSDQMFDYYLGYENPQGNLPLRQTIAEHMRTYRGTECTSSSILITSGAQQALYLIVQCLLKPGDAVAIEDPSYAYSLPLFHSAGIRTHLLPVHEDGINPEDIVTLYKEHRIKMVFLNPNFQNPTGTLLDMSRKLRILEISNQFGIPIIEDDPYSLTSFDGKPVPTLKSLDRNGTVLYVSSLTKIVASGLRIGWIIGPQAVIDRLSDAKQQIDFGHSIFPQWIANRFLSSDEFHHHLNRLRKKLELRRDKIVFSLQDLLEEKVEFLAPEGGIHLWCKLNHPIAENQLLKEAIKHGVVFVPGRVFGSQKGYVRFTYGRAEEHLIHEAISRFSKALKHATT